MTAANPDRLQQICQAFCIHDPLCGVEEVRQGIINHTYKVTTQRTDGSLKAYMVQRINTHVFTAPVEVMENIDHVTEYLRGKLTGRTALHFHHTADRKNYIRDGENFWRMINYIPSTTYDQCQEPAIIRSAGRAFGEFQALLADFDAGVLHETISHFHDTQRRYENLEAAARGDICGRVQQAIPELKWLFSVRKTACTLSDMRRAGTLPLRVTHNDTKLSNVLFTPEGTEAIVVIDLDTVMPGLVGNDFGDAIRYAANTCREDCTTLDAVHLDMDIFRAFACGFLSETARMLTPEEVDTLALSAFVMTVECGVRFLEDYLAGDVYFQTDRPGQNLDRARCQIALALDIQQHLPEMDAIIRNCLAEALEN